MIKKLKNLVTITIFFLFGIIVLKTFYYPSKTPAKAASQEWYNDLVFKNKNFSFQFARHLGYSTTGAADIGECFSTARKITDGDIVSWHTQWLAVANRLKKLSQESEHSGHLISAGEQLMRASNYYLAAGFYLVSRQNRNKRLENWKEARGSFTKALTFLYPDNSVTPVRIPYGDTTMPGYFCKASNTKKDAPLLIVHSGFDGTAEEVFWYVGAAAMKRGYNCLIFEGPGQGEMIIKQNIPFRFDWEVPVKAVLDFAEKLPSIDKEKIALMGRSFGGYLAPRAAALERRVNNLQIKACIANGGIFDFSKIFSTNFPPTALTLIDRAPQKFNAIVTQIAKKSLAAQWAFDNGMWRFAAKDPADFMKKIKEYNLKDVVKKITCPTLVVDSQAEDKGLIGQAKLLYDALECPKTFLLFTREEAAQAHCQVGANLISTEKIFNWLDENLG